MSYSKGRLLILICCLHCIAGFSLWSSPNKNSLTEILKRKAIIHYYRECLNPDSVYEIHQYADAIFNELNRKQDRNWKSYRDDIEGIYRMLGEYIVISRKPELGVYVFQLLQAYDTKHDFEYILNIYKSLAKKTEKNEFFKSYYKNVLKAKTRKEYLKWLLERSNFTIMPFTTEKWMKNGNILERNRYRMFKSYRRRKKLIGMSKEELLKDLGPFDGMGDNTYELGPCICICGMDCVWVTFEFKNGKVSDYYLWED